ncbi:hypothetical protein YC2023_081150 [Brassica napus]
MHGLVSYRRFGRARSLRSDRALARARSLRSDRAGPTLIATELACMLGHRVSIEFGLSVVRLPYSSLSAADLDTCPLPSDNRI